MKIISLLIALLLVVILIPVTYWLYTFHVLKPQCLKLVAERTHSLRISFSSSANNQEKIDPYVAELNELPEISRTDLNAHTYTDGDEKEVQLWTITAYHSEDANPQQLLAKTKDLATKNSLELLSNNSNYEDYNAFHQTMEEIKFNPALMVGEILYIPFMFLSDEPSLLAPPLRMFTLCAQGEV